MSSGDGSAAEIWAGVLFGFKETFWIVCANGMDVRRSALEERIIDRVPAVDSLAERARIAEDDAGRATTRAALCWSMASSFVSAVDRD